VDFSNSLSRLADVIVNDCLSIEDGDLIILEGIDLPDNLLSDFADHLLAMKIQPYVIQKSQKILIQNIQNHNSEIIGLQADFEINIMKRAKAFIGLRFPTNLYMMECLGKSDREKILTNFIKPVHFEYRNNNLQWVYFRFPTREFAKNSGQNYTEFTKNYFNASLVNYEKMAYAFDPLAKLISKCQEVRIVSDSTDLRFYMSGKGVYKSCGQHNLPDGEIFTSPDKSSIEGFIRFNIPSIYYGNYFENIELEFRKGKIVGCHAENNSDLLKSILDIDEGAKFVGEFAIGLNPFVKTPILDILWDEKMHGSLHLAIGNAYPVSNNGNKSAIHWDLILNQTSDYGGGALYFDERLVRKNGLFIDDHLQHLNPQNLINYIQ